MTTWGRDVVDTFINWFPMLLLIGVWWFYLRRMQSGPLTKNQADRMELTRRQVESLERIAALLEKQAR